jgi:arginase family enzyme
MPPDYDDGWERLWRQRTDAMTERFVLFPSVTIERSDSGAAVANPVFGTRLRAAPEAVARLEALGTGLPLDQLERLFSARDLRSLRDAFIVVAESDLDWLSEGLLDPVSPAIGTAISLSELTNRLTDHWVVLGAPVDMVAPSSSGARHGPAEIRNACPLIRVDPRHDPADRAVYHFERRCRYRVRDLRVADAGDVHHVDGEAMGSFGRRLSRVVEIVRDRGCVPLVLGGDQSVSWFAVEPLLRDGPLGILHFDAHHDLYAEHQWLHHGNPFRFALQRAELVRLHQIGLRTVEPIRTDDLICDDRLTFVSAEEAAGGSVEQAFANLPRDIPYYLSFDIDCIAPSVAPETGTPEVGGLSYYRCMSLLDYACSELRLVGMDVVEVQRRDGGWNMAARVAGAVAVRVLLNHAPSEAMGSYLTGGVDRSTLSHRRSDDLSILRRPEPDLGA